jgi:tRNA pseudouridine55 synthase
MTPPHTEPFPGVILVDKPKGCTSFDVVKKIKQIVKPMKVGHTGTLDPLATGLLAITLGEATKLTQWLMAGKKRYLAKIRLGYSTDTYDSQGQETSRCQIPKFDDKKIKNCLKAFIGPIDQIPPAYSALRVQGKRMHQLARQGIEVERKARSIEIFDITLLDYDSDWIELDVSCSPGTYIRSLANDLSKKLGTEGHLESLRRIETGGWTLDQACKIEQISLETLPEFGIPLTDVLARFPKFEISQEQGERLRHGQNLHSNELEDLKVPKDKEPTLIWFCPPQNTPIILALVSLKPDTNLPQMKYLRLLSP